MYLNVFTSITLFICATAITLYAVARLLFAGFDISLKEDLLNLLQTIGTALLLSVAAFIVFVLIELIDFVLHRKQRLNLGYMTEGVALVPTKNNIPGSV